MFSTIMDAPNPGTRTLNTSINKHNLSQTLFTCYSDPQNFSPLLEGIRKLGSTRRAAGSMVSVRS